MATKQPTKPLPPKLVLGMVIFAIVAITLVIFHAATDNTRDCYHPQTTADATYCASH